MDQFGVLLLQMLGNEAESMRHSTCMALLLLAEEEECARTRNYLTTRCLKQPKNCFWHHLYEHGADSNFINVVGTCCAI
jgi:hypothetical protein